MNIITDNQYFENLLDEQEQAVRYAQENADKIIAGGAVAKHIKYGSFCHGLGLCSPSMAEGIYIKNLKKGRFLKKPPDQSDYTIYAYDEAMKPVYMKTVFHDGCSPVCRRFFEYNGMAYSAVFNAHTGRNAVSSSWLYRMEYRDDRIHTFSFFDIGSLNMHEVYDYDSLDGGYIRCHLYHYVSPKFLTENDLRKNPISHSYMKLFMENNKVKKVIRYPINNEM